MKRKIEIFSEVGIDSNGMPIRKTVKTFKNEPDAMTFYRDWRNARRYGTMFMYKNADDGSYMLWDDRKEDWVSA